MKPIDRFGMDLSRIRFLSNPMIRSYFSKSDTQINAQQIRHPD